MPISVRWVERHSYSWDRELAASALLKGDIDAENHRQRVLEQLFDAWAEQSGSRPSDEIKAEITKVVDLRFEQMCAAKRAAEHPPKDEATITAERAARARVKKREEAALAEAERRRADREKEPRRKIIENPLWPRKR